MRRIQRQWLFTGLTASEAEASDAATELGVEIVTRGQHGRVEGARHSGVRGAGRVRNEGSNGVKDGAIGGDGESEDGDSQSGKSVAGLDVGGMVLVRH